MSTRRTRTGRLAASMVGTMLIAATFLTACAATDPSDGSGDGRHSEVGGGVTSSTFEQEVDAWNANFDACLREAGLDIPERRAGELLNLTDLNVDEGALKAAAASCSKKVGPAPVDRSAPSDDEYHQMQLSFAKCMRDSGYDWDDPQPPTDAGMAGAKPIEPGKFDEQDLERCAVQAGFGSDSNHG